MLAEKSASEQMREFASVLRTTGRFEAQAIRCLGLLNSTPVAGRWETAQGVQAGMEHAAAQLETLAQRAQAAEQELAEARMLLADARERLADYGLSSLAIDAYFQQYPQPEKEQQP